ncbi:MAG: ATP-binding protein [Eggerthella lenta]
MAYADPGTDVRVRTGLVTAADGFVWWELTVSDQGRELSPQHLERIFEKFYRADESRGSAAGGAGLGLAISREIARAHGGDIYASSDAGLTSFTVWIPRTQCGAPDGGLLQHASVLMGRGFEASALCAEPGRPASRLPRTVLAVTIGGLRKRRHVPLIRMFTACLPRGTRIRRVHTAGQARRRRRPTRALRTKGGIAHGQQTQHQQRAHCRARQGIRQGRRRFGQS